MGERDRMGSRKKNAKSNRVGKKRYTFGWRANGKCSGCTRVEMSKPCVVPCRRPKGIIASILEHNMASQEARAHNFLCIYFIRVQIYAYWTDLLDWVTRNSFDPPTIRECVSVLCAGDVAQWRPYCAPMKISADLVIRNIVERDVAPPRHFHFCIRMRSLGVWDARTLLHSAFS